MRRRFALRQIALSQDKLPWLNPEALARESALAELPAEQSSYVYVANDPLRWADPTGESGWVGFGIVVGGTVGLLLLQEGNREMRTGVPAPQGPVAS